MKEKYIDILSLTAGTAVLYYIKASGVSERPESLFMVFGAALFLGFVAGRLLKNFGLPSITSYLLMGVLFGPYCMNVFSASMISDLRFIDEAALSIIAMTAGGEINFRKSRISLSKAFVFVVVQMVVTSAIVFVFLNIFGIYIPSGLFAAGTAIVFMSVIVNAKSPSETVAVIVETGSKGRMTDYILTSVIIKDILVIVVFAVTLSFYGSRDEISVGGVIMKETLSIIFGIAASVVIILYKKYIKSNQGAFILLFTLVLTWITKELYLNSLLVFIFAGIGVNNFSKYGHSLVQVIEENSGILYIIFFFMAGTSVNIPALQIMWAAAVVIVLLRLAAIFAGCYAAGTLIGEVNSIRYYSFLGFIGQAGVSIGFAKIIGATFEGWGPQFQTLILAVVALNLIIGPVGFRFALKKAGEVR